jgi:uncharacterized NAD(P)/FAD-binding protein YdhS
MTKRVVVIGKGPTGGAVVEAITNNMLNTLSGISEVIWVDRDEGIDGSAAFGADTKRNPDLISNMTSAVMSITPDKNHFSKWLSEKGLIPADIQAHEFYATRYDFGEYVKEKAEENKKLLRSRRIKVRDIKAEIIRITRRDDGGATVYTPEEKFEADYLVLATGGMASNLFHKIPTSHRILPHPYPFDQLKAIPKHNTVLINGASLTSIDVVSTLETNGHKGRIYVTSRSGTIPSIRPRHDPNFQLKHCSAEKLHAWKQRWNRPLTGDALLCHIEREFIAAGVPIERTNFLNGVSFNKPATIASQLRAELEQTTSLSMRFSVLRAFSDELPEIWKMLTLSERRALIDNILTPFNAAAFPCPPQNGAKFMRWFETGYVRMRGTIGHVMNPEEALIEQSDGIKVTYADGTSHLVDNVINATGLSYDIKSPAASALYRQMLRDKVICSHDFGGAKVHYDTGQVLDENDTPIEGIYIVGPMTRGTHLYTNSVDMNAKMAERAARHICFSDSSNVMIAAE